MNQPVFDLAWKVRQMLPPVEHDDHCPRRTTYAPMKPCACSWARKMAAHDALDDLIAKALFDDPVGRPR